ncbi:AAA family ATPase [Thermodesulfobacteriota bacterium]
MKHKILNHFSDNFKTLFEKYLPNIQNTGGNELKAVCPFHEDTNPSFNFNNQTGKYYCHGCGRKGDVFHFYGEINSLDTRRDFRKILNGIADDFGIPWEQQKPQITKTYDYLTADGELLFQVCRKEPKSFQQRQPNGNGRWKWNLKGISPVLYRLPEVLKADEVLIVEGEKDADNLSKLGFTSTTCAMGAKKWRDEYNSSLKGKNVVLMPDNDNEGREHMARIGTALNGIAKSLKWLDLPDLPSKGDVSDFIEIFQNRDEAAERLSILIDQAKPYEPPRKMTLEDAILESQDFSTIDLPIKRKLLLPWLTEQSISLISGWRGTGKTWFAMGLTDSVTRCIPFGPWEVKTPIPCLYLEGEMPAQDIRERIKSLNPMSERDKPLYVYSDAYSNHLGLPRANLLSEKWRTAMKRILTTRGIKLWVVDNLASLTAGIDENSKKDWDPINDWLLNLRFAGISTVLLHHTNKEGGQRGTSAREDNIDISIALKQPRSYQPEDGAKFIVNFQKARVATKDLHLISDTQFHLTQDDKGRLVWTWGNVKGETKKEVLRLFDEGSINNDIADMLGISKGHVSKIKKKAIEDGLMNSKGKLTQQGFLEIAV